MLRVFSILISVFFISTAMAQEPLLIEEVLTKETVRLSNGITVMLGGVIAQEGAKGYLEENFKGQVILPLPEELIETRYGEIVAHVKTADGRWLQKELVQNGMAYAFTMPSFRDGQDELLAAENNQLGALKADQPIDKSVKGFQIVEGQVVDVVERGQYVYLNFGEDYKTDFTISIKTDVYKAFLEEGVNVLNFKGKRLRVRGWIDHYNGPFITLTYPEQLQLL